MNAAIGSRRSVLLIGNFLSATGKTHGVYEELCERLINFGWQVRTTSDKPNRMARIVDMLTTIWKMRRHYCGAQVEVYSGKAFIWAEASCWLLTRLGRPYVLALHGGALPSFANRHPARVGRLLRSARLVTAPSNFLAKSLSALHPDIQIVPNSLDVDRYPFRLRAPAKPRLIWLRAFHDIYNPIMAVHVLQRVMHHYPEATLTMVGGDRGDGSLAAVKREVERLGLTRNLQITGPCRKAEVPERLAECDIFLNTTNFDNTPVSVLEAMACGLCVVTTDVGGIPDLLEDSVEALLVRQGDTDAMVAAVERILQDTGLAQQLSAAGRKKTETLTWKIVLPQWESVLQQLVGPIAQPEGIEPAPRLP